MSLFQSFRVFHATFNRWFYIGIWVTASFLRSPRFLRVSLLIFTMLCFVWSWLYHWFPLTPVSFLSTLTTNGITVTFFSSQTKSKYLSVILQSFIFTLWYIMIIIIITISWCWLLENYYLCCKSRNINNGVWNFIVLVWWTGSVIKELL